MPRKTESKTLTRYAASPIAETTIQPEVATGVVSVSTWNGLGHLKGAKINFTISYLGQALVQNPYGSPAFGGLTTSVAVEFDAGARAPDFSPVLISGTQTSSAFMDSWGYAMPYAYDEKTRGPIEIDADDLPRQGRFDVEWSATGNHTPTLDGVPTTAGMTTDRLEMWVVMEYEVATRHYGNGRNKVEGSRYDDIVDLGGGRDRFAGGGEDDVAEGGKGGDVLKGEGRNDRLWGDGGNDRLFGGPGDDTLFGGQGSDKLFGGAGADLLEGGAGGDRLEGGKGADRFIFTRAGDSRPGDADVIVDFESGKDEIDLSGVDGDPGRKGNQSLDFIGEAGFTGAAGALRVVDGALRADLDGDGKVDLRIDVKGDAVVEEDLLL